METRRLLILIAVVVVVGGYILFFERHQPTTEERRERAEKVFGDIEQEAVEAIEINRADGSLRLEKRDDGWRLAAPYDYAADESTVSGLLSSLLGLKAERRLSTSEVDPADHGLAQPSLSVVLHTGDGISHRLAIGDETVTGGNRAVSRGDDEIIICPGWFASDLEKRTPDQWRSRDVVQLVSGEVASLEITSAEDVIHAVQVDRHWQLLEPVADLADREHAQNLISNLSALKVEEFVAADSDLTELGLEPPQHRITVVRSTGDAPVVIELGATREHNGATQIACRRGSDLFWVNDRVQPSLGLAPILWRSAVVYPFESWDVEKVTLSNSETSASLDRTSGMWRLADGGEADNSGMLDRLSRLSRLKAAAYDLVDPATAEIGRVELTLSTGPDDTE
jgi:hypothetical protein